MSGIPLGPLVANKIPLWNWSSRWPGKGTCGRNHITFAELYYITDDFRNRPFHICLPFDHRPNLDLSGCCVVATTYITSSAEHNASTSSKFHSSSWLWRNEIILGSKRHRVDMPCCNILYPSVQNRTRKKLTRALGLALSFGLRFRFGFASSFGFWLGLWGRWRRRACFHGPGWPWGIWMYMNQVTR